VAERRAGAHDPLVAIAAWLESPAATRIAEQRLRERRLAVPAREVLDTALANIWQRMQRADGPPVIDDVERYCSIVIRNVVRNIAAGFDRHDLAELDELERLVAGDRVAARREPVSVPPAGSRDDGIRAAIESAAVEPWVVSAALSFVTLSEFPDLDVGDAPRPLAGARPDQARMWPSLWFAGMRDGIFPDGGAQDPAQRRRLSRAASRVRSAVEQAAAVVWSERGVR